MDVIIIISPLIIGWILDKLFGDPDCIPHPVVWFGKTIAFCERHFNKGENKNRKEGYVRSS